MTRASTTAFDIVKSVGLTFPEVEATTNWAGAPVLKVRGCFVAGLAVHRSVEDGTLVVRRALDDRERLLEDAPDTYYVADYYRRIRSCWLVCGFSIETRFTIWLLCRGGWRWTGQFHAAEPAPRSGVECRRGDS